MPIPREVKSTLGSFSVSRALTSRSHFRAFSIASEDSLLKLAVGNLISDIIKRVEGIFLWLILVMDDLVGAHAGGASLMELSRRLS